MLPVLAAAVMAMGANLHADPPELVPGLPSQPGGQKQVNVRARILADVRAVQPGKGFRVGVLLEMKPGWHVYWRDPGDAGLATSVALAAPKGFSVGPLCWPIPTRFQQAGDITGFGYEKALLLWAKVAPPKKLPRGSKVRITASVAWLACKAVCVPGGAELELTLPVRDKAEADNAKLFANWQGRLPRKAGSGDTGVQVRVDGSVPAGNAWETIRIDLAWKDKAPSKVEWIPGPSEALEFRKASVRTTGRKTEISIRARLMPGHNPPGHSLESLVVYADADGPRRAVEVAVPLAPARKGPRPPAKRKPKDGR